MATEEVTGTLTSGGLLRATPDLLEVSYPGTDRSPVAIDLNEVVGVRREGNEVTLLRLGDRETGLNIVDLADAVRLQALVRSNLVANSARVFDREIERLHRQGFRLIASTPRMAQMIRPKRFNYFIASLLFLLFIVPAVIYIFYWLSQRDETALVMIDESGEVRVQVREQVSL